MALELAEVIGRLASLQRFPIEPLAGESPNTVLLSSGRLVGDRVYELRNAQTDKRLTASTLPQLLDYGARYSEDLVAEELDRWTRVRTPDGQEYAITDAGWLREISRAAGCTVRLAHRPPEESPLRLISRPTLRLAERTYGSPLEPQRLRANLVVEIADGKAFDENVWIGRRLRIGEALLEILDVSADCIETAHRAEPTAGDPDLLAGLVKIHGGHLGVSGRAVGGQRLRTGDPVVLVD